MLSDRMRSLAPVSLAVFLPLAALLLGVQVLAQPAFGALEFPALSGRVVDNANLLNPSQERDITKQLERHEAETSNQVVVVTLPSLQGTTIENYGNRLGRHWAVGQKDRNNGVLLIVAPKSRKVRIEVGYGLEGDLPDAIAKLIIEQEILPAFRKNDYPAGVIAGVDAILAAVAGTYEPQPKLSKKQDKFGLLIFFVFILIFVLKLFLGDKFPITVHVGGYRLGGGGGSSSGGGGFSGGGGSFGGGGSSGSW